MRKRIALLAGVAAIATAHAAPFRLHEKIGGSQQAQSCGISVRAAPRTILDAIDQPLIVVRDEAEHCIVTSVSPAGFFSLDDEASEGVDFDQRLAAIAPGAGVLSIMLLIAGTALSAWRKQRHRRHAVRRRGLVRRKMACI